MTDEERFIYNHGYGQAKRDFIKELEKIKAEIDNIRDVEVADGTVYVSSDDVYEILDKKIAELTGEQNDTN